MRALLPLALAAALTGCSGQPNGWGFSCQSQPPTPTSPPTTVVTARAPGEPLDEAKIRSSQPALANALDTCATQGSSQLRGRAIFDADRVIGSTTQFYWREMHVSAMRYA
ncbi:MAG TPA: hypothetical protein VM370_03820 [Candidatus Thermoplasmatota archaeon]|nr:hypothetical protein [Candidatus Thermoplasmatota archaeon]